MSQQVGNRRHTVLTDVAKLLQSTRPGFQMPNHHLLISQCLLEQLIALIRHGRQSITVGSLRRCLLFNLSTSFRSIQLIRIHLTNLTILVVQTNLFFIHVVRHARPATQLFHHPNRMLIRSHHVQHISRRVNSTAFFQVVFHIGSDFDRLCWHLVGVGTECGFCRENLLLRCSAFDQFFTGVWIRIMNRMFNAFPFQSNLTHSEVVSRLQIERNQVSREHNLLRLILLQHYAWLTVFDGVDLQTKGIARSQAQLITPAEVQNVRFANRQG